LKETTKTHEKSTLKRHHI